MGEQWYCSIQLYEFREGCIWPVQVIYINHSLNKSDFITSRFTSNRWLGTIIYRSDCVIFKRKIDLEDNWLLSFRVIFIGCWFVLNNIIRQINRRNGVWIFWYNAFPKTIIEWILSTEIDGWHCNSNHFRRQYVPYYW